MTVPQWSHDRYTDTFERSIYGCRLFVRFDGTTFGWSVLFAGELARSGRAPSLATAMSAAIDWTRTQ